MSAPWIFVPQLPPSAPSTCRVDADEAKHAAGSRRLRTGDRMHLFDGRGVIADASMGVLNRDGSIDAEIDALRAQPLLAPMLEIASAVPKGDRLGTLLESLGPLGAARWTPLNCTHSVLKWSISSIGASNGCARSASISASIEPSRFNTPIDASAITPRPSKRCMRSPVRNRRLPAACFASSASTRQVDGALGGNCGTKIHGALMTSPLREWSEGLIPLEHRRRIAQVCC